MKCRDMLVKLERFVLHRRSKQVEMSINTIPINKGLLHYKEQEQSSFDQLLKRPIPGPDLLQFLGNFLEKLCEAPIYFHQALWPVPEL